MPTFYGYLLVFLGGGVGTMLRHSVNRLGVGGSANFPLGTMLINITGCFAMGMLIGWFASRGEAGSQHLRLLLTTGLLGGFTTFSAFSLDAAYLWQRGETLQAAAYVLGSVILSLIGVFAGLAISRTIFS